MINDFLSSWALFHNTYLAGYLIAVLLSIIGVLVTARDQIFLGAAVSQASTLGIALAMWAAACLDGPGFGWLHSDTFPSVMAVLFCVAASLFTWRGGKPAKESYEAATGWVFLLSAAFSILIVSKSPHGLEEIYRLMSSNIIGATTRDVGVFSALLLLTVFFFALHRRRLLLLALDPEMTIAVQMNRKLWESLISLWLGLVVGLSMRTSGMLFTFGCMVLPSLIAKNLCRAVGTIFYAAPLFAFAASAFAFILANYYDCPPAQMTIGLLCVCLGLAWLKPGRRIRAQ